MRLPSVGLVFLSPIFFAVRFFNPRSESKLAYGLMDFTVNESMVYVFQLIRIFLN